MKKIRVILDDSARGRFRAKFAVDNASSTLNEDCWNTVVNILRMRTPKEVEPESEAMSCYGAGYWQNDLPWLNDDAWING